MNWIDHLWYAPKWFHWPLIFVLLPLSGLFWLLSATRRLLYKIGFKTSTDIAVPVIVVGNISVGGNGKTPLVVHLAKLLQQHGYQPGVLSRGYGGKGIEYPMSVNQQSAAEQVGDEPILMVQHINCPLVVDPVRSRGAEHLVDKYQCNVIVCDDGLQHYALNRDIELIVVDGQRRCGNQFLMPAGPLREGLWRSNTVDFVVVNGGPTNTNEFLMTLEPEQLINLADHKKRLEISHINQPVSALAGIGNPQRFFTLLEKLQVKLKDRISFVDHHAFSAADIPEGMVIMTEKDAVKCKSFAHKDCWFLPVKAQLPQTFDTELLDKLQKVRQFKQH